MPKKKAVQAEQEAVMVEAFNRGAQLLCGHVNKQFVNSKGKLEDLACTLPPGHGGDHSAPYVHLVAEQGVKRDERGNSTLYISGYHEEKKTAYWSDAAGMPAVVKERTQAEDWERLKKSRNRERGVDEDLSKRLDNEVKGSFGG